jgi:hypothetical protein
MGMMVAVVFQVRITPCKRFVAIANFADIGTFSGANH